jgi:protein TonB
MSRLFTVGSIVIHVVVIAGVFVAQLVAVGPLPMPRQPLTFQDARLIKLTNIPLPAPRPHASGAGPNTTLVTGAPLVPPSGVTPDAGLENAPAPSVDSSAVVGIDNGTGTIDIGTMERVALPPPPPPVRPARLHAGIQPPRKIADVVPEYPALARMTRVEGVVILEMVIDARGLVESVRVLRPIHLLDQAAVDAVRQWRFTPALLNGEPVPVVMTVTVKFSLQNR